MSIYSGFATRQQEETYDHCINSLLYILQKRILKFYTNEKTDEYKFSSLVQKIYLQIRQMEKAKYLDPKCSYAIQQLFEYLMKQNHSDRNATVENDSINQKENLKNQVYRKRPTDDKSLDRSNVNEPIGNQKTYQIPIRTEKSSPDRGKRNQSKQIQNVGKIISSKSKQKAYPVTIEHGTNMIRKRTPSTSQGSRLIQTKNISSGKQRDFSIHRPRKASFNEGGIKYKPFSKSSARIELDGELLKQHELHQIIQGYIEKSKRSRISSQNNSRPKLNRSIQQETQYFTSKI